MKELGVILSNLQEEEVKLNSDAKLFLNRGSEIEAKRLFMQVNLLNRAINLIIEGMTKYDESGHIGSSW